MKRYILIIILIFAIPTLVCGQEYHSKQVAIKNTSIVSTDLISHNSFNFLNIDSLDKDRDGQTRFLVGNIVSSIGAYAWMTPIHFGISDIKGVIATYTFVGAGGIIIPSLLTRNKNITMAQAKFKNYGQYKGLLDGFILDFRTKPETGKIFGLPLLLSVTEATLGYIVPGVLDMTKEQVMATTTYGTIGYGFGFLSAKSLFPDDTTRLWSPFMVGGSLIGEIGGYFLSKNDKFTNGDSYALIGTSYLGTGIASTILIMTENNEIIYPTLTLGLAAGIVAGSYLGNKYDLTGGQGMLTNVFGLTSGLIAGGATALILPIDNYDIKIFAPVISIASTVGFGFAYRYFIRNGNLNTSLNKRFNYSFDINPAAAFSVYNSKNSSIFNYENQYVPIGQFKLRF